MKKRILMFIGLSLLITVVFTMVLSAQDKPAQYIGANKCKMCHKNKARGDQFGKWQSGPHVKAYATLATDKAKEVAAEAGIEGNPQEAAECLKCHVTAHAASAEAKAESYSLEEGVSCEACHGPGSLYKSMKVMKALRDGSQDAGKVAFLKGDKESCLTCHNEASPTFKPFSFDERVKDIAHPIPAKE